MTAQKKQEDHTVRNIVAGAAVVGAGLVAAKVLSNEDTREDISEALKKFGEKTQEVIRNVVSEFDELKHKIESSKESKDLQHEIDAIAKVIKDMKESNEDDANKLVEQVKASVEKLRSDFEEMQNK